MAYKKIQLPSKDQTSSICISTPKTAAMFFDLVWCLDPKMPNEYSLWGETDAEITMEYAVGLKQPSFMKNVEFGETEGNAIRLSLMHRIWNDDFRPGGDAISLHDQEAVKEVLNLHADELSDYLRKLSEHLFYTHKINTPPVYSNDSTYGRQYEYGDLGVIVSTLTSFPLIDESKLTWEQVKEFRSDGKTRDNIARLIHMYDKEWLGKPSTFIAHDLEYRLEQYHAGLKKHGISTALGTIKTLLSSKWFSGSAAIAGTSLAVGENLAAITAAVTSITSCAITLAEEYKNLKEFERSNTHLAFVHSINKKFG